MSKSFKTVVSVSVTKEHIKNGERHVSTGCPVALALLAKGYHNVTVCDTIEFVNRRGRTVEIDTPKRVEKFIGNFDSGKTVKPFTFELGYN